MRNHKPDPGQQDRKGIHDISHHSVKGRWPAESQQVVTDSRPVPFQLVADFQVEVEKPTEFLHEPDVSPEERSLFLAIINTPEALNRICRLAIVSDLSEDSDRVFERLFMGPDPEDIFEAILPYLPVEIEEYWTRLRREDHDSFEAYIEYIFEQFSSSLTKTAIIDLTTSESIPLWVNRRIHPGEPRGHYFPEEVDLDEPACD
jgi:hypothetical protein